MVYGEQLAQQVELLCQSMSNQSGLTNTLLQIRKSSSSVYANISEAQYPQSLKDMLSKLQIARKECLETESWLKHLYNGQYIDSNNYRSIRNLCGRVRRLLIASCITLEKKINEE